MDTRYFTVSLDSDHDLSVTDLDVSLDQATWVTAEHAAAPSGASTLPAPEAGFSRYWWRVLVGPGQPLDPTGLPEPLTLFGRLTDAAEVLHPTWIIGETEADLPPALSAECWPVIIPPVAQAEWNALDGATRAYAEALAVSTLRTLTAYQVGGCPVTVWPVRVGCRFNRSYVTYPITGGLAYGDDMLGSTFWPVMSGGSWLNLGCADGCGRESCTPGSEVRLPGSILGGIQSVTELGVVLNPSKYRLVSRNVLRKTDGTAWACNPGDLEVIYYQNPQPDGLGAIAAGALAVEYARGMAGKACRLPSRATNVQRQGVQVQLATPADLFPQGITGVSEADLYIRRINPNRLASAPTVWSPDL